MPQRTYTDDEIAAALMFVVANHGNVNAAAEKSEIPRQTLERWVNDTHREQYAELDRRHGNELEAQMVRQTRASIVKAGEMELDLLEKLGGVQPREIPAALQAVASVKDKGIGKMLALTGRPSDGRRDTPGELMDGLKHLANKGLLRINVDLGPGPQVDAEGTAEELPPGET
jgi:hypothetical protein